MRLPVLRLSALVLCVLGFAAGLAAIPPQHVFRSGIDVVHLGVAVMDKAGTAVGGLKQEDFVVYEEGKKQEFRYLAVSGADIVQLPIHICLVIDTSGSMVTDK